MDNAKYIAERIKKLAVNYPYSIIDISKVIEHTLILSTQSLISPYSLMTKINTIAEKQTGVYNSIYESLKRMKETETFCLASVEEVRIFKLVEIRKPEMNETKPVTIFIDDNLDIDNRPAKYFSDTRLSHKESLWKKLIMIK